MERYRVLGRNNVEATTRALEIGGAKILSAPRPDQAPFEYRIKGPDSTEFDLVCYAFTANKYRQGKRPTDEHRFQVKYGSDFKRYHDIYIDPTRKRITLMYGVHHERDLFIAVDPAMHNPTWFSMSIEVKEAELVRSTEAGWHGWERERTAARRKRLMPLDDLRTEAVIAFHPKLFLRYVAFERLATGMDTGERLLLADKIGRRIEERPALVATGQHPLETELGLSSEEILDVLGGSFRLLVAVRGSVAEHHLGRQLASTRGISGVRRLDADGQPDFEVTYRKRTFRIECKNVLRRLAAGNRARVDFQKTRAAKGNPCSRYYLREQFDVLAACMHPVTERWEYNFAPTTELPAHKKCQGRISERIFVEGDYWDTILPTIFDRLLARS